MYPPRHSLLAAHPAAAMSGLSAATKVGGARTVTAPAGGRARGDAVAQYRGAPTATTFAAFSEDGQGVRLCVHGRAEGGGIAPLA